MAIFKHKRRFIIPVIILILIVTAVFIPFRHALVFYKKDTNQLKAFLPLKTGDTFQLIWKHSIHLTDVVEKYQVKKNEDIKQYEIVFDQFGIGMPSYALKGEKFVYKNGKHHIKNMNRVFPELKVRNGKVVSKNRIVWGDKHQHIVPWNDYFKPGDWFTLKIERLSLWDYMRGVKIHD